MTGPESPTLEVLREIRDGITLTRTELRTEIASVRTELRAELASVRTEIQQTNEQLGTVETTLLDLAEQQRFVVRHLTALTTRDRRIEADVDELRGRVDAIERRLP